jgi:putative aldouronate transport system substrate-binding protein
MVKKQGLLFVKGLLASIVVLLLFYSAGGQDTGSRVRQGSLDYLNVESEMPIAKQKITLTVVTDKDPSQGRADEIWFWKWAEKEMNIHFEVTDVERANDAEKINLMFASNELPDIFFNVLTFTSVNVFQYGQKERQLLALNDLIDKYAPTIKEKFRQDPAARAQSACPDGNIYTLPGIDLTSDENYTTYRPFINGAWLKKLGLKMPETLDDFYNVLVAFRDKDPNGNGQKDEIPISGRITTDLWYDVIPIISAAMGYVEPGIKPCLKDGEAVLFGASPLYGEYLKYMNRLFSEKLLDNDYFSNTTVQINAKGAAHRIGAHTAAAAFIVSIDDYLDYDSLPPLTSRWNNKKVWRESQNFIPFRFAISRTCKYPEAAIRFADFFYSEKGSVYWYYGPPKGSPDTLGLIPGWIQNPDGSVSQDISQEELKKLNLDTSYDYLRKFVNAQGILSFGSNNGMDVIERQMGKKMVRDPSSLGGAFRVTMDRNVLPYYQPLYPVVYFDEDTNDRILELTSTLNDYMTMMDARFITGIEPLSNIDAYLARLKDLGVGELEKIYKEGYAVYRKNLK